MIHPRSPPRSLVCLGALFCATMIDVPKAQDNLSYVVKPKTKVYQACELSLSLAFKATAKSAYTEKILVEKHQFIGRQAGTSASVQSPKQPLRLQIEHRARGPPAKTGRTPASQLAITRSRAVLFILFLRFLDDTLPCHRNEILLSLQLNSQHFHFQSLKFPHHYEQKIVWP